MAQESTVTGKGNGRLLGAFEMHQGYNQLQGFFNETKMNFTNIRVYLALWSRGTAQLVYDFCRPSFKHVRLAKGMKCFEIYALFTCISSLSRINSSFQSTYF